MQLTTRILTELWIIFTTTLTCYGIGKHYWKIQNIKSRKTEKKKRENGKIDRNGCHRITNLHRGVFPN